MVSTVTTSMITMVADKGLGIVRGRAGVVALVVFLKEQEQERR